MKLPTCVYEQKKDEAESVAQTTANNALPFGWQICYVSPEEAQNPGLTYDFL